MAELLENPERIAKANKAIAEYQSVPPRLHFYELDSMLDDWLEACEGVAFSPELARQHAWMHVERSMAASANTLADESDPEAFAAKKQETVAFIAQHMAEAERLFLTVLDDEKVDDATKAEVKWELQSARCMMAIWELDKPALRKAEREYKQGQVDVLESALREYRENGGVTSFALAHAAAASILITDSTHLLSTIPTPPRHRSFSVDAEFRSDLYIRAHGGLNSFAVTDSDNDWRLRAPFSMFAAEKGRLSDNLAFLQALVNDKRSNASDNSIKIAGNNLAMHLIRQTREPVASRMSPEKIPANPFEWYENLGAGRHPYVASARKLDEGLSELALAHVEGRIEPESALLGGWMYVEAGMGRAIQPIANTISPHGDMDAAEDLLVYASERMEAGMDRYDALLAQAAVPMYRAVATGEEPPFEHYAALLAALGKNVAEFYASQADKKSSEAMRADQMVQVITTCLLFAVDTTRSFVVVPSSPRQNEQWQIAAWEATHKGFVPQKMGRIILAEKNTNDRNIGAVGMTPKNIGQQQQGKRTVTLQHLVQHVEDAPANARQQQERQRAIEKAYSGAIKTVIAAVN